MKDIMNIAVVNFTTIWGNKEANLKRIKEYVEAAGKRGADLIVFPETALSGYDDDTNKPRSEKMHVQLAETIPGPATDEIAEITKKYNMFAVFGMPEKDKSDPSIIYNSAAIVGPDGTADTYRKIHLPFTEADWSVRGDKPVLFDTPWGPIGVAICYDTYCFPELVRYYRAKGARLLLNVTACPDAPCTSGAAELTIPAYSYVNYMYIASSNLCGFDKTSYFIGGSNVIGPDTNRGGTHVYVGKMFNSEDSDKPEMFFGTIDLSMADFNTDIPIYRYNEKVDSPDWRPDIYKEMYQDILDDENWKNKK